MKVSGFPRNDFIHAGPTSESSHIEALTCIKRRPEFTFIKAKSHEERLSSGGDSRTPHNAEVSCEERWED